MPSPGTLRKVSPFPRSGRHYTFHRFSSRRTFRMSPISFTVNGKRATVNVTPDRSEEHTSELQSRLHLVCRLLLEKKKLDNSQVFGEPRLNRFHSTTA